MKTITTPRFSLAFVAALALVATPAFASDVTPHQQDASMAGQSVDRDCHCHGGGPDERASHAARHNHAMKADPGAKGAAVDQEAEKAFIQQVWTAP
ncbi:MAG TPA: hypothetical protein VFE30_00055 [Anaeromyxobacteraceae bacterium]|jgi:hypothetical protein|nr:hypothetical protein [Anaeromyxobacteraceae bacterium]